MNRGGVSFDNVVNDSCPWSGGPVQTDALTVYEGKRVGFCNPGCRDKFEKALTHFDAAISQED